jgi:protein SCO1
MRPTLAALCISLCSGVVAAQSVPAAANGARPGLKYFGDVILLDQDGKPRRLYTDLMKDKTVVINAMFTTCKDSCPVMAHNFASLQDWLGDRLGTEANVLSFSVDPETDTPARLKEYAARFHARPGWYFLTGSKDNVNWALSKLGLYTAQKEQHLNIFLIGNDRTGLWKKAFGMAKPTDTIQVLNSVLNDRP